MGVCVPSKKRALLVGTGEGWGRDDHHCMLPVLVLCGRLPLPMEAPSQTSIAKNERGLEQIGGAYRLQIVASRVCLGKPHH